MVELRLLKFNQSQTETIKTATITTRKSNTAKVELNLFSRESSLPLIPQS